MHELPGLISDRIELLSLELQRAGQVLAQIVALIVAAAIWPLLPVAWRGRMGPDTASILVAVGLPLAGLLFGKRVRAPLPSQRSE